MGKSRINTDNLAEKKRSVYEFRISMLEEDPDNIRKDYGDIDALAQDIAVNGVRIPLRVRRKNQRAVVFSVTDGNRRLRATRMAVEKYGAHITAVTCQIEEVGQDDAQRLFTMLSTGTHGKPLTPEEEGAGYRKALETFGVTIPAIAKRVGRSEEYVRGCIHLAANPEAVEAGIKPAAAARLAYISKSQAAAVLASGARSARQIDDVVKGRGSVPKRREVRRLLTLWDRVSTERELGPEEAGFRRGLQYAMGKAEAMKPGVNSDRG